MLTLLNDLWFWLFPKPTWTEINGIPCLRLSPGGSYLICDKCGRTWAWGDGKGPNCPECLAKWEAIENAD